MVKRKEDTSWTKVQQKDYPNEAYLQNLIYDDPSLIPVKDISENVLELEVIIKEAGLPGSGSTDLIGIDRDGQITIVECKLAKNPEVKRKVIGQVLEYGAFLWRKSYDEFDQIVKSRAHGKTLIELMQEKVQLEDWRPDEFINKVTDVLVKGTFRLIIAVDQINDELKRTVQYLNSHSGDSFELYLLEFSYFSNEDREIIIPRIFGIAERIKTSEGRRQWTEEEVLKDCGNRNDREVYQRFQEIHEFGKKQFENFSLGTGAQVGSFTYFIKKETKRVSVITLYSNGSLTINLGNMNYLKIPEEKELRQFVDDMNKIKGLEMTEDLTKFPGLKINPYLMDGTNMSIFKNTLLNLIERIKKA